MNAYESFVHPAPMYRGTDFWMLNDTLEETELIRQLHEMKKQGVYSFIARTYIGLKSDYPGADFKSKLKVIVKTAKELDMKVFLQAGYMPECVLDLPLEYSLNYLKIYRKDGDPIPKGEQVLCAFGDYVITEYCSGTFLDMFNHDSVAFYLKQSYENMWRDFEEDYGKTICSIWVDEPSYAEEYLPFPRGFSHRFRERFGYDLTEKLYLLYFDEEGYRTVRYHYRKLLQDMLEEHYFSMLRAWCNSHGLMASGHLMLEDTLYSQISRACAVMPYYKYFDLPGIDLLCAQMNWREGEIKPGEHRMQDPVYTYRNTVTTTPIQCASAARQMGSEHVLCEMYGVTTQDMTFRNQKHLFDYMVVHGVNHRSVHGIFYSLHGRAKRAYPAHINTYQPYWKDLHVLYDYVSSVSRFAALGQPEGDVLVLHPLDSAYCEYVNAKDEPLLGQRRSSEDLRRRDREFQRLLVELSFAHCNFDLGDERSLEDIGGVEGNRIRIGKMTYGTVVLPRLLTVQKGTVEKLCRFAENGGRVIVLGNAPILLDGFPTKEMPLEGIPNLEYATDDGDLIHRIPNQDYTFRSNYDNEQDLWIRRRVEGREAYYVLFNSDCAHAHSGTLVIKGSVRAECWDGFSKKRTALPYRQMGEMTEIDLTIPEGGSLLLYTEETAEESSLTELPIGEAVYPVASRWQCRRKDPNALLLEFCSFRRGEADYSEEYPVLAIHHMLVDEDYHGPLTQRYTFTCDRSFEGLHLALEDASAHTIRLNGEPVSSRPDGHYWARCFETVPLPPTKEGVNVLELTRDYVPLAKMKRKLSSLFETQPGVELESAYLVGDFGVRVTEEPERNGNLRFSRQMVLTEETEFCHGELTRVGYPFYAGTVELTGEFSWNGEERAELSVDALHACLGRVSVNGIDCGILHSPPYRVDISHALRQGTNTLTLTLTNSLRNLLGPYHRPKGEEGCFQGGYAFPGASWIGIGKNDLTWYEHRIPDTPYWTDSYLQIPFGVQGVTLRKPLQ
ncbi:MAG: hypothetical protein IKA76_06110 [Clostridia bacterium]|nr:hypothetical protein [Clostridia bacterium]